MKRISDKRRQRNAEAAPVRAALVERVGRCEYCGRHWVPLCCHEILRGQGYRAKAQDQLYAMLVLCWRIEGNCHDLMDGKSWGEQLAVLRRSRPEDFDITAFHLLASRCYPDESDVKLWHMRLTFIPTQD